MIEYPYILSDRRQEMNLDEKVQLFRSWLERMAAYRMALTIIGVDKTAKAPSHFGRVLFALYRQLRERVAHDGRETRAQKRVRNAYRTAA
jgi:hypothetical protein